MTTDYSDTRCFLRKVATVMGSAAEVVGTVVLALATVALVAVMGVTAMGAVAEIHGWLG